tara:strand:+ start:767 stop:3634 length:2868 start_codon:yes stop_codon:yes gene_type:complete
MATNTSLRPRIRPDIDKQMTESLRPKSREEGLKEKLNRKAERNRQTKEFADLEYRAELEPQLSWNPIARLGYDPDKHKVIKTRLNIPAAYYERAGNLGEDALKRGVISAEEAAKFKDDNIVTGSNVSVPPIISHEFTERGFTLLRKKRNEDPKAFDKKYGDAAGKILKFIESGNIDQEYYIELFDDLNTRFNTSYQGVSKDFEDFPKNTIRDTVQSSYFSPRIDFAEYKLGRGISEEDRNKRIRQIEEFQKKKLKRREKGKPPRKEYGSKDLDHGIFGLMDAAQDILTEQGEPPKFKKESLNFFQRAANFFKDKLGFDEGGLAEEKEFEINSYEVDGKEMLAIDFKDGKRIFENQIHQMFELNKTAPMTNPKIIDDTIINFLRKNNPTRDEFIKHFTTKRVAEGGMIMKDQMEMAFMQEGGLKDDGMDVDPVSGNEIPPGSMASEVRDDIPAQLSEGEYVVPADVVQYFGVKFFEDLRMEAKRGLADMESNGRIGGEPIDMPRDMPMDDTPTVAVSTGGYIDGIPAAEYNVGGMASNLYNNPTQMDQEVNNIISTIYNNPQVMDELARRGIQVNRTQAQMMPQQMNQANPPSEARMGMNPGGLTSNETTARDYVTSPTIPGSSYLTPGASSIYASPPELTTSAAASNMPSVEYCNSIDMDYNPSTKMCVPREMAQTPQQTSGGSDDDGPEPPKPEPWFNNVNWEDPTAQMDSFFGKEGRVGSAIAGVAGSMIGGPLVGGALTFGAQVSNLAQARAMANVYDAMGMSKEAQDIRDKVNGITEQNKALGIADDTINKFVGSDGDMLTISAMKAAGIDVPRGLRDDELQDYLKDLSDESRKALRNKYAPNYKDPVVTPTKDDDKDDGPGSTPKPDDNDDFIKSVIKDPESFLPPSTVDSSGSGSTNPGDRGFTPGAPEPKPEPKPSSIYDDDKAGDYDDDSTGINKGGLMSKKKKKKK